MQECIETRLRTIGLKATPQRKAILDALDKSPSLLTARELFAQVHKRVPGVNLSTIYRNLEALLESGCICKITLDSGESIYEIRQNKDHHHHVICLKCGVSEALSYCPMKGLDDHLKESGFHPTEHRFVVYGYCKRCRSKLDEKADIETNPKGS